MLEDNKILTLQHSIKSLEDKD